MKAIIAIGVVLLSALPSIAQEEVVSDRRAVAGEPRQEYFLIQRTGTEAPASGYKLLLVLPGGDGSAQFNPFVTNLGKFATGEDFLVAQLIAVKWTADQQIVWPTKDSAVRDMAFTTESFIAAVVGDIKKGKLIDDEHVYTLSWSSSGPAAYAASLRVPAIKGSFVAMSVFKPDTLEDLDKAKGHRYYIYHSPDDRVCPFRMAEEAKTTLSARGATVEFMTYEGGHGWHGNIFGAIRAGVAWLQGR